MQLDRDFLAQIVITLAVCIGGWMMFVEPRADELKELEQALAETEAHPMRTNQKTLKALANRVEEFRERVRLVEFQNAFARDSSQMYGRIMTVAKSLNDPGCPQIK